MDILIKDSMSEELNGDPDKNYFHMDNSGGPGRDSLQSTKTGPKKKLQLGLSEQNYDDGEKVGLRPDRPVPKNVNGRNREGDDLPPQWGGAASSGGTSSAWGVRQPEDVRAPAPSRTIGATPARDRSHEPARDRSHAGKSVRGRGRGGKSVGAGPEEKVGSWRGTARQEV